MILLCMYLVYAFVLGVSGQCGSRVTRNGAIQCHKQHNVTTCHVTCNEGFFPQGDPEMTCRDRDSSWSTNFTACTRCPTLNEAKYRSTSSVTRLRNRDIQLRFVCEEWTDLLGPKTMTCSAQTGRWREKLPPICQPNFGKCGKNGRPRCPTNNKELFKQAAPYKSLLSEKEKDLIRTLLEELNNQPRIDRIHCSTNMCHLNCNMLSRKWLKTCRKCKRRKLNCERNSGNVFGA